MTSNTYQKFLRPFLPQSPTVSECRLIMTHSVDSFRRTTLPDWVMHRLSFPDCGVEDKKQVEFPQIHRPLLLDWRPLLKWLRLKLLLCHFEAGLLNHKLTRNIKEPFARMAKVRRHLLTVTLVVLFVGWCIVPFVCSLQSALFQF